MTAHVFIHDLAELDRAVLNQAPRVEADDQWRDANARHAYRSLMSGSRKHDIEPQAIPDGEGDRAAKFLHLGREAEARKALPIARLHYRVAAKYGSRAAEERLADLDGLPVISHRE